MSYAEQLKTNRTLPGVASLIGRRKPVAKGPVVKSAMRSEPGAPNLSGGPRKRADNARMSGEYKLGLSRRMLMAGNKGGGRKAYGAQKGWGERGGRMPEEREGQALVGNGGRATVRAKAARPVPRDVFTFPGWEPEEMRAMGRLLVKAARARPGDFVPGVLELPDDVPAFFEAAGFSRETIGRLLPKGEAA